MLFGNKNTFAIEIEPVQPYWSPQAPTDKGPWAKLTLWARNNLITENVDPGNNRLDSGLYTSLTEIADWFVRSAPYVAFEERAPLFPTEEDLPQAMAEWLDFNPTTEEDYWYDTQYDWWSRHFLAAADSGAWLPTVGFVRVEGEAWISWRPRSFDDPHAIRYIGPKGCVPVGWEEFSNTIDEFVDTVSRELREKKLTGHFPWSERNGAFVDAHRLNLSRYIQIALGLNNNLFNDIFSASNFTDVREKLGLGTTSDPWRSVALQALRDLFPEPALGDALVECEKNVTGKKTDSDDRIESYRDELHPVLFSQSPEKQGREAARLLRQITNLGEEQVPKRVDQWMRETYGVSLERKNGVSPQNWAVAGWASGGTGSVFVFSGPRTKQPWAYRAEAIRGLGHLLLDRGSSEGRIGAGSSNRTCGPRRRRSGAFLAEFLLPSSVLWDYTDGIMDRGFDDEVFRSLMNNYHVGAGLTAWQLWNNHLLSSQDLAEHLIEVHGTRVRR